MNKYNIVPGRDIREEVADICEQYPEQYFRTTQLAKMLDTDTRKIRKAFKRLARCDDYEFKESLDTHRSRHKPFLFRHVPRTGVES